MRSPDRLFTWPLAAAVPLVALMLSSTSLAQGVPVFDPVKNAKEAEITAQMEADLALQRQKAEEARKRLEADRQQVETLGDVSGGMILPGGGAGAAAMIADLEAAGDGKQAVYATDNSAAAEQLFGEGRENVEQIIIRAARDTHHLQKAGLSLIQWRCWVQAMIWQESRFNPHAESPVGAYGLTQIMPDTAGDLGIRSTYRSDPYIQAEGGARYLAQQLNAFDGDMILALAAYNAGAGNVRKHGGVPPFAETRKYVQVIPAKYREYMAKLGAADQIGSIEASYLANAEKAMIGGAVAQYADEAGQDMGLAMARLEEAMSRLDKTENAAEAMALNSFVRAEFARLLVIRTRLIATRSKPLSAEAVAAAAAFAQERRFMDFQGRL
ncbi:lytic transglycosylase domain-containing protein [Paracoccus benzoatiresistens]|uniref:Lytic transglycosylase domain-containing protein n=1 Tax=Paracoccus benzoatiresistens TaxID=2997341 RepID=A0ABT4J784_9RHOB|nr:lytic transglycosylase domain-containing protein [Paracoccus sp. EF6]MCZ0962938.1 lytic transglycosylase domain-containing protein [Paracoccus sp. EF6]